MAKRTDPHRPGAIIPAHYVCEVDFSLPSSSGGFPIPGFRYDCERDLAIIERDEKGFITKETPGTHGTHERGLCCVKRYLQLNPKARFGIPGKCDVCGAHYVYGSAFRHELTGEVVLMGHDCARKYECLFDASEAELARARHERALAIFITRKQNAEQREQYLAERPELKAAFDFMYEATKGWEKNRPWAKADSGLHLLRDLESKLTQYKSLSDKQIDLAVRVANELKNPAPKVEEPKACNAPKSDERMQITGTVLHTKWKESDFGGGVKMLLAVDTPEGRWKCWGSVPSGVDEDANGIRNIRPHQELRGRTLTIRAKLEVSKSDPTFAYLKRPTLVANK